MAVSDGFLAGTGLVDLLERDRDLDEFFGIMMLLRSSPCSAAPESPSAAPISAAIAARGARMVQRISPDADPGVVSAVR